VVFLKKVVEVESSKRSS